MTATKKRGVMRDELLKLYENIEKLEKKLKIAKETLEIIGIPLAGDGSCGFCYEYGPNGSSYPPEDHERHEMDCPFRKAKEALKQIENIDV